MTLIVECQAIPLIDSVPVWPQRGHGRLVLACIGKALVGSTLQRLVAVIVICHPHELLLHPLPLDVGLLLTELGVGRGDQVFFLVRLRELDERER